MSGPQILGLVGGLGMLVTLFELMRRHSLRERFALIWSVLALSAIIVGLFPTLLTWATHGLGLQLPSNLVFFVAILVLFALSLQHANEIGRAEEKSRTLAEEVALLRLEIERLKDDPDA